VGRADSPMGESSGREIRVGMGRSRHWDGTVTRIGGPGREPFDTLAWERKRDAVIYS
jgi:hypothetical protein